MIKHWIYFPATYNDGTFAIYRAIGDWGDVSALPTTDTSAIGVPFLSRGSVKGYDRNGNYCVEYVKGEKMVPPPAVCEHNGGIVIAKEPVTFYCIAHPNYEVTTDGEVTVLDTGDTYTFSGNLFVAEGSVSSNGVVWYREAVKIGQPTTTITAQEDGTVIATFYHD
jgi:hypothetical protein